MVNTKAAIANGGLFYLIDDEEIKKTAYNTNQAKIDKQVADGTLFRADTLIDLAQQLGMYPNVLTETITKYNQYVDQKYDPEFGKDAFDLKGLTAPFYATPRKPAVHHTIHASNRLGGNSLTDIFTFGRIAGSTVIADEFTN